ncbi:hypothetical protein CBR_g67442, partial [Chara braunii]
VKDKTVVSDKEEEEGETRENWVRVTKERKKRWGVRDSKVTKVKGKKEKPRPSFKEVVKGVRDTENVKGKSDRARKEQEEVERRKSDNDKRREEDQKKEEEKRKRLEEERVRKEKQEAERRKAENDKSMEEEQKKEEEKRRRSEEERVRMEKEEVERRKAKNDKRMEEEQKKEEEKRKRLEEERLKEEEVIKAGKRKEEQAKKKAEEDKRKKEEDEKVKEFLERRLDEERLREEERDKREKRQEEEERKRVKEKYSGNKASSPIVFRGPALKDSPPHPKSKSPPQKAPSDDGSPLDDVVPLLLKRKGSYPAKDNPAEEEAIWGEEGGMAEGDLDFAIPDLFQEGQINFEKRPIMFHPCKKSRTEDNTAIPTMDEQEAITTVAGDPVNGDTFKASGEPGEFARSWVERGVLQVKHIWNKDIDDWITVEDL